MKKVNTIIQAEPIDMGGIRIDQALPVGLFRHRDPFLLIHHWKQKFAGGQRQKEVGVGPHPHRGFSPVTFIYEGIIEHRDSRGNTGTVSQGGTQWMNAGMGIVHSERPASEIAERGGTLELIQFWVNSPIIHKMDQPKYYNLPEQDTPKLLSEDNLIKLLIVSGVINNIEGPIQEVTRVTTAQIYARSGGRIDLTLDTSLYALIYVLHGSFEINGKEVLIKQMAVLDDQGKNITLRAKADSQAVLLAGRPLGEPVNQYGPFVMSSQTEIMQAIRDYQMGKMGVLIEEF